VRSTSASENVSPTPVMPVTPDSVRFPKFQLRRRRVCATTKSPRYQIDCQVTERSLKSSEAVKVPQPLNLSIQIRAKSKLFVGKAPRPAPPSTARIQIVSPNSLSARFKSSGLRKRSVRGTLMPALAHMSYDLALFTQSSIV